MAEENVKIDLVSSADTSGFTKFESAYNSLSAAKQGHIATNDLLVDSERRVRTNLADLVSGLSNAQDATQAAGAAIKNLSEVFQVGFAGTVIAGVGAAIIEQFSKVSAAVEKTTEDIKKTAEELSDLEDEIQGKKLTPEERRDRTLRKDFDQTTKKQDDLQNPGVFKSIAIGFSDLFGGSMSATLAKQQRAYADQQQIELKMIGQNAAKEEEAKLAYHPIAGLGTAKSQNMSFEQAVVEANNSAEIEAKNQREAQEKGEAEKRSDEAAARAAAHVAEEKQHQADEAARAAAKEEGREDRPERAERIKAHIIAGGQRSQGGGGGAYSVITRDPVVEEARKHTMLLTQIANTNQVIANKRPASDALAA